MQLGDYQKNFNPDVNEYSDAFGLMPEGWYEGVIYNIEVKPASTHSDASPAMLAVITFEITENGFAGKRIIDRANFINPNEIAQNIGQGQIKKLCRLTNVQYPVAANEQVKMYGKKMGLKVVQVPSQDGQKMFNNIKDYCSIKNLSKNKASFMPTKPNVMTPETPSPTPDWT